MPRSGGGIYSKGSPSVVSGTTIQSAAYNTTIDDLVTDANAARPISAGGTGAANVADARTNLGISATNTPFTPAGNIAATTTQAAIVELDTEKAALAGATFTGGISGTTAAFSGAVSGTTGTFSGVMTGAAFQPSQDADYNQTPRASQMPELMPSSFTNMAAFIAALESTGMPGRLPSGTFALPASLVLNSAITLRGAGRNKTFLTIAQTTGNAVTFRSTLGSRIEDLSIVGPSSAGVATSTSGALVKVAPLSGFGSEAPDFVRVNFQFGFTQVAVDAAYSCNFDACQFLNYAAAGITLDNNLQTSLGRNTIRGCRFNGPSNAAGIGVYHIGGNDLMISDCFFINTQYGYVSALKASDNLYNIQMTNCIMANLPFCVRLIKGTGIQNFNFGFSNNHLQGTAIFSDDGGTNWNGDITIVGNQLFPVDDGYGISMNSNALTFSGNMIDGGGFTSTTGIIIGAGSFNWNVSGNLISSVDTTIVNNKPLEITIKIWNNVEHLEGIGPPTLPISTVATLASPWEVSASARRTKVYARSGTVSVVEKRANYGGAPWVQIGTSIGATAPTEFTLEPHEALRFTYSVAPFIQAQELS